jgi:hypothetical protein
VFAQVE